MITIHWIWILLIATASTCIGALLMACLCAGANADHDIETYIHNMETGRWEKAS